jgi:hyperosmotically inducible protein
MTTRSKLFILTFLLAALVTASGAGAAAAQDASKPQRQRDSSKYEAWLKKEVRHQLVMLPYYTVFDNLEYKVEGDRVTLIGQVVRPSLKSDAEAVVKLIEGVRSVVNRIEVLPLSPNDDRIRLAVYRAIYSDSALQRYALQVVPSIHIIVNGGHVTLEGVAANEADKNIANIRANEVPGVFSVTNHLQVERKS